jgi:hypothetical protein
MGNLTKIAGGSQNWTLRLSSVGEVLLRSSSPRIVAIAQPRSFPCLARSARSPNFVPCGSRDLLNGYREHTFAGTDLVETMDTWSVLPSDQTRLLASCFCFCFCFGFACFAVLCVCVQEGQQGNQSAPTRLAPLLLRRERAGAGVASGVWGAVGTTNSPLFCARNAVRSCRNEQNKLDLLDTASDPMCSSHKG